MAIKNLSLHSTFKKKRKMKPHGLSLWQSLKRWKAGIFEPGLHKGNGGWKMWNSITSKRHIFYPFISSPLFISFLWHKASFTGRGKNFTCALFRIGHLHCRPYWHACHFVRSCEFGYPYFHCALTVPYLTPVSPSRNYPLYIYVLGAGMAQSV